MADAESNLVPSEAADQVEVALEEQAAADDGILYLNEYQYENDLVTDFARLVASPRRRGSLYVAAAIAALIGIGMLVAGGNWIKFGVVLIVFGAFLAWWSKNLHHTLARDFIDAVEADESMGGRYRRVAANEDGLMVWGTSGKSQFFPFEKLDHVLQIIAVNGFLRLIHFRNRRETLQFFFKIYHTVSSHMSFIFPIRYREPTQNSMPPRASTAAYASAKQLRMSLSA